MNIDRRGLIAEAAALLMLMCPAQAQTSKRLVLLSGHPLWTPISDPTLVAWWDASYTPNLTFNSGNVSAWTDRKSSIVASQGTGAQQPAWSATARNGTPGITFVKASSQILAFTAAAPLPSGTSAGMIAVAVNNGDTTNLFFSYGPVSPASGSNPIGLGVLTSDVNLWTSTSNVTGASALGSDTFLETTWTSGSSPTAINYVNGTQDGTGTLSNNGISFGGGGGIGAPYRVGVFGATAVTNTIQQIVVTSAVPSANKRMCYEGWESWQDGKKGVNLPSNHRFKNRPPYTSDACL